MCRPDLILGFRRDGDRAAAPEGGCEELEGGAAAARVGRQEAAEGGELSRAEEEGAVRHVVRWDGSSYFGVRNDVVVRAMRACGGRRVAGVEEVSLPDRWDGRGLSAAGEFTNRGHKLDESERVAHRVIQADCEDESSAFQPSNL